MSKIDRGALSRLLYQFITETRSQWGADTDEWAGRVSALVLPNPGVTLTPEEARTVIEGITLAAEVTRRWDHLIATPLSAVMTKMQDQIDEDAS